MKISAKFLGNSLLAVVVLAITILVGLAFFMMSKTSYYQEKSKAINDISIKVSSMSTSIGMTDISTINYYPRLFSGSKHIIEDSILLAQQHDLKNLQRLLKSTQDNLVKLEAAFNENYNSKYFSNLRTQIILQLSRIFEEANRQANKNYRDQHALLIRDLVLLAATGVMLLLVLLMASFIYFKGFLSPVIQAQQSLKQQRYKDLKTNKQLVVTELEALFSALQLSQKRLIYDATHDELTHLDNRAEFKQILAHELIQNEQRGTCSALLYFDLDNFKTVNDSLGHVVGDKLLIAISSRLSRLVNKQDCLARIGGDEFALLLTNLPPQIAEEAAKRFAEHIQQEHNEPFKLDTHELSVSTSIGIAIAPTHGNTVETLMRNVDAALYDAKNKGKATYSFYTKQLTDNAEKLLKIEREIERAIESDEFVMYYQPQVDARNDRVVGLEALIRWNHPDRGLLPPPEFIPIAEKTILIRKLGMWIINHVFAQVAQWQTQWQKLPKISINISTYQFDQPDFIEQIEQLIERHQVDPTNFYFEITESTFLNYTQATLDCINQLRAMGFEFAIDDFGTGYSCLSYLNRLPIDIIKIDKEFVDSVNAAELSTSPLESIIILAAGLGLKLVAEGVEDSGQVDFLKQRKCYVIQGYHYSKPLPPEQISGNQTEIALASIPSQSIKQVGQTNRLKH